MKPSFIYHIEWFEVIKDLSPQRFYELECAIIHYATTGEAPIFKDETLTYLFRFISKHIDDDRSKYEEISRKRAEAGRKGREQMLANDSKNGKCQQMPANGSKCQQMPANGSVYDNDNDNDINKKDTIVSQKVKRFVKPKVEEVRAYCQERKNNIDPEAFIDHYEAKGWMIGKQPMKDWRAAVRTWERNHQLSPEPQAVSSAPQQPSWRTIDPNNPNHPPVKEWEGFLHYLDSRNSVLVITPTEYSKIKVMCENDGRVHIRRVIDDLIRMAPIMSSVIQEADRLLDLYAQEGPDYKAPINPKSNQTE